MEKSQEFRNGNMPGNRGMFPKLSLSHNEINPLYDVIIIGSGYGASIAASRCARAGQTVCVLERGKEWQPGDFPESLLDSRKHFQVTYKGKKGVVGDPTDLYEVIVSDDITILKGCGLGGTSLINASVGLDADPRVFQDERWPQDIRNDMSNLLDVDRRHVNEMLLPNVYPDYYPIPEKLNAMEKAARGLKIPDIEDIGQIFKKTPLFVNFESEKNEETKYRFNQPPCNGCGNCVSGCNTGAKNTLNMNYLPDAKVHGAEIFTQISVISVERDPYSSVWKVHFKRLIGHKHLAKQVQTIRSTNVILGAGSIGSTEILLRSKEQGLELSETLGSQFTGNGDALGFSYHGEDVVNSVGMETGMFDKVREKSPGPTITSAIDLRSLSGMPLNKGMIIEEGTPPGGTEFVLKLVLAFASKTLGINTFPSSNKFEKFKERLKDEDLDKTLAFLCMGHDDSSGVIKLDPRSSTAFVSWEDVGHQRTFEAINERLLQITKELKGTFVKNPVWSRSLDKQLVTVHPLGGCPMGETGENGVVNHKGQVFIGDTADVHPGLYVMDGAIIPTSVGVNPIMTIAMLAERCCRLMIKDNGWKINYDVFKDFNEIKLTKQKPGIHFTERMQGQVTLEQTGNLSTIEMVITIESQDIEYMIEKDRNHEATVVGNVTCEGLSSTPMHIDSGIFNMLVDSETIVDAKEMWYKFKLISAEGELYRFVGKKTIKADKIGETGLSDTTTLYVDIFNGHEDDGHLVANGIMKIGIKDFSNQLNSMEIINTHSSMVQLKWKANFGKFFADTIWHVYSGLSECKYLDPNSPPRKKRPLRLGNATPVVYKVITGDNVELRITRYNGGSKGPLIACHGMGTSSILFTLDTIPTNFLEFFLEKEFDVWLFETRLSTACPWVSSLHKYTIDDMIDYDIPAAVDKVLEITEERTVQILTHCVSSVALWGTILSGKVKGKIRSAIFSQAAALPEGSFMNQLKSQTHLSAFLDKLGVKTVTAYTDKHTKSAAMNCFARNIARISTDKDEHCSSDVCHRLTFYYGLIYEHGNFNVATHDILHELFGTAAAGYFHHLSKCFRSKKLVDKNGHDIYLPGLSSHGECNCDPSELEWVKNINIPVYMFCGTENQSFSLRSVEKTCSALKRLNPKQDYQMDAIPGYGHVDHFIGKNARFDVWPKIFRFLDKYAENGISKDRKLVSKLRKAVKKVRLVAPTKKENTDEPGFPKLIPEKELVYSTANEDDSDTSDEEDLDGLDMEDAAPDEAAALRRELSVFLPDERTIQWKKKKVAKSSLHKPPLYVPPEADPSSKEKIIVEKVFLADAAKKREIYVFSDLHLGGHWSKETVAELKEFLLKLAKIAEEYIHTIVMLGDVLEMWMTPITLTPASKEEFINSWKSHKEIEMILRCIRKMADEDNVRVYYIRGNHDCDMDADMVHELFGPNVSFIPGKLIYCINTGCQEYRIRFEHGHDYDLFNCADLAPDDSPLQGKPIGYYISRCAQSAKENYFSDTEMVIQNTLRWILSVLPNKVLGSGIAEILSKKFFQTRLFTRMFEGALDLEITDDSCILLENEKWVRIKELIKYPIIKLAIEKFGPSRTFSMIEGALGNFEDFLSEINEDVVVVGHTHHFRNAKFLGKLDHMYFVNCGTWIDLADHLSYVKLIPPKCDEDGSIKVEFNESKGYLDNVLGES